MLRARPLRATLPSILSLAVLAAWPASNSHAKTQAVSFHPIVYRSTQTAPRAAGDAFALYPFYSESHTTTESLKGFHPLWSWSVDHARAATRFDALWPLFSWSERRDPRTETFDRRIAGMPVWFSHLSIDRDGSEKSWDVLFPLYFAGRRVEPEKPDKRFEILFPFFWRFDNHRIVFPLYYADPGESFAVWPAYGQFYRLFSFDSIRFVLWPLWVESHRKEVDSYSVLWPVFNVATGGGVRGAHLWPLAGYREGERIGGKRGFYLWPLGNYRTFESGALKGAKLDMFLPFWFRFTHNKRDIAYYFPAYGYSRSPRATTVSWFWPAYARTASADPIYEKTSILWFLWTRKTGPRILKWEAFPLAGQTEEYAEDGTTLERERAYFFWPFIQRRLDHKPEYGYDFVRRYALPFYSARERRYLTEDGPVEGAYNLWPLASWGNEKGVRRLSILNLFWHGPGDGIDRNWAPLWTFWSSFRDDKTGAQGRSLFGPFYRSYKDPATDRWEYNFLFIRVAKDQGERTLSLLGGFLPFRIGGEEKTDEER